MYDGQIAAIVLAAGSSSRMGGIKKEYQRLSSGLTVLESSARVFASVPSVSIIVIVIAENSEAEAKNALSPDFTAACNKKIIFVTGGKSRRESVFNALSALVPHDPRYALIHDGARPFINAALTENIIIAVKKYGAVIPLLPLTDTPKECEVLSAERGDAEKAVFVKRHLKRADAGIAQTPQAFKFPEILHAHEKASAVNDEEFTDDAEIWGRFCTRVAVIPGESANKKITFKEDLFVNEQ